MLSSYAYAYSLSHHLTCKFLFCSLETTVIFFSFKSRNDDHLLHFFLFKKTKPHFTVADYSDATALPVLAAVLTAF